jgi:type II secretory ATPase GspE/PulE/Tfp pilus assembly ATPase PilB-like protein
LAALKEKAVKKGMVTMRQDGLIQILQGDTTLEELERTIGEDQN